MSYSDKHRFPYEIFLDIVQWLALDTQSRTVPIRWLVIYSHHEATRFSVEFTAAVVHEQHPHLSVKDRFKDIRNISQIDRRSRAIFHRLFRSFPLCLDQRTHSDGPSSLHAYLISDDLFQLPFQLWRPWPSYREGLPGIISRTRNFVNACILPTPSGFTGLESLRIVSLDSPYLIFAGNGTSSAEDQHHGTALGVLHRLPCLQTVIIDSKDFTARSGPEKRLSGIVPIPDSLDELHRWNRECGLAFPSVWRPLEQRGVRLYVRNCKTQRLYLELVIAGGIVLAQYSDPTTSIDG